MSILVMRWAGDKQGSAIVSAYLTTPAAQTVRGRAEINENCSNRVIETCQIVHRGHVRTSEIVRVVLDDTSFFGRVAGFSRVRSVQDDGSLVVDCNIEIEREA